MHDPKLIAQHGDYLESHYAPEILSRLGGYALFWASYIGNDRESNYLPMPSASPETLQARVRIWEHLYTLFESIALCWRLEERLSTLAPVATPSNYADALNDWVAFYAHLGRVHDMAEKVASEFAGENLFAPFDSFYEKRHTVLHYPKVPMRWVENVLAAPLIGERPGEWNQNMRWADLGPKDLQFLADILSTTLRDLEKVTNAFLYKIAELAAEQKGFVVVRWPENDRAAVLSCDAQTALRRSTDTPYPPSGVYVPPSG